MQGKQYQGLTFGVPKEIMVGERRVAAIVETVQKLTEGGAKVLVEQGAGLGSFVSDEQYQKAGAEIRNNAEDIFKEADVILKVKEPQFNKAKGKHEVEMMHSGQTLVTFIHPAAPSNHQMVKDMVAKGIVSLTLDGIPRISRAQGMDALTSMSTVAGYKSVILAADRLAKFIPMIGTAVGMIKPATAMVIGTGVAGLQAVATAKRLGAVVHAIDIRPDALEQAKSLGAKELATGVPADVAVGKGGYANSLSEEWLIKEREAISKMIDKVDLLVLTALIPGKIAPILITEEMVKSMQPGSVIIDVAIDQGGNCALTEGAKVIEAYGVSIDGTKNIPGMVPISSTWMFAHNIYNFIAYLVKDGKVHLDLQDEIVESSLVSKDGKLVHAGAIEAMGLQGARV